jgi:hypothetical protein
MIAGGLATLFDVGGLATRAARWHEEFWGPGRQVPGSAKIVGALMVGMGVAVVILTISAL